jgi:predicted  nucleic acid-binding Zn-ribbon protein
MNTEHIKSLIDAEVEALLSEITELRERIAKLEHESFHLKTQNMNNATKHEYIGHWNHKKIEDKTKVTCNTSKII